MSDGIKRSLERLKKKYNYSYKPPELKKDAFMRLFVANLTYQAPASAQALNDMALQGALERLVSSNPMVSSALTSRMDSAIRGMDAVHRNIMDAISLAETAEDGAERICGLLRHMRDIGVTQGNPEEYQNLAREIDEIASRTSFNGVPLLASEARLRLRVSKIPNDAVEFRLINASSEALGVRSFSSNDAVESIDRAMAALSEFRASCGSFRNRLQFTLDNLSVGASPRAWNQSSPTTLAQANQNPGRTLGLLGD